jgi:hypothetical protein
MTPAPYLDEDPDVSVYDGQRLLGLIFARRDGFLATDADRGPIGRFATDREAARAVLDAARARAP